LFFIFTIDDGTDEYSSNKESTFFHGKSLKGIETTSARKLLNRLKAFTDISHGVSDNKSRKKNFTFKGLNDNNEIGDIQNGENDDYFDEFYSDGMLECEEKMVEKDVFGYISRISGMPLSTLELTVLSDCTDVEPTSERIKIDVIFDVLNSKIITTEKNSKNYTQNNHQNNGNTRVDYEHVLRTYDLSESAVFALRHVSHQIWRTGAQLKR
jgi:hypothetical protein